VVSSRARRDKTNADKFQDYFYESLAQKGENYDKIVSLQQCLKLEPKCSSLLQLGKNI
jgi:hypothetical protein